MTELLVALFIITDALGANQNQAIQARLLQATNEARVADRAHPLAPHPALDALALEQCAYAANQISLGREPLPIDPPRGREKDAFNAHRDEAGRLPKQRDCPRPGRRCRTSAENLVFLINAQGDVVTKGMRALMSSPSHRENILRPAYNQVGLGVCHIRCSAARRCQALKGVQPDSILVFTQFFAAL